MANMIADISKYLMILLIAMYTFWNFRYFGVREERRPVLAGRQNRIMYLLHFLAYAVMFLKTGEEKPTGLPSSNVLYYDLTEDAWLCVRPSGTEPKVKFYYGIKGTSLEDANEKSAALGEEVLAMINGMLNE